MGLICANFYPNLGRMQAHLSKRSNGDFQFRYQHTVLVDGKKKRTSVWLPQFGTFHSRDAIGLKKASKRVDAHMRTVSIQLQAERANLINKLMTNRSDVTVGEWFADCIASFTGANQKRPRAAFQWVRNVWGEGLKLEAIDYDRCEQLQRAMLQGYADRRPLGKDTQANYLSCVSQWMDKAVRKGLIQTNHIRSLKKPRTNYIEAKAKQTLTPGELRQLDAARDKFTPAQVRVLDACVFMGCTGLYWCEVIAARWKEVVEGVDSEGVRCMQYAYPRAKNKGRSNRINRVPVILSAQALQLMGERKGDEELIFPGQTMTTANVNKHLRHMCRIAGIDKRITSGAWRHMKGEQMARDGATDVELANQMGWVTMAHLLRYTQRAGANSARVAGNLF